MRILLDCTSVGSRTTGVERYERELGARLPQRLAARGFAVTVLVRHGGGDPDWTEGLLSHAELLASPFPSRLLTQQLWIPAIAARVAPDFAFFASFPPSPLVFAAKGGRVRVARTIHDAVMWSSPKTISIKNAVYFKPMEALGTRRYAIVHTVSEHARSDIERHVPRLAGRILVSGGGVTALPQPNAGVRARFGLTGDFLLNVGTLEPRKNLVFLLETFRLVRQRRPELKLVLAGRFGWGVEEVKAARRRLGLEESVVLTGAVSDAELAGLYASAAALVYPSLHEGFGLPLVEAMSSGLPVISSNTTSMPEVCGDAAILLAPSGEERWAEAVERVLASEALRRTMIDKGRAQARRFTWDSVADRVAASFAD